MAAPRAHAQAVTGMSTCRFARLTLHPTTRGGCNLLIASLASGRLYLHLRTMSRRSGVLQRFYVVLLAVLVLTGYVICTLPCPGLGTQKHLSLILGCIVHVQPAELYTGVSLRSEL